MVGEVSDVPAAMALTPLERPAIAPGEFPQQVAPPALVTAHVYWAPAAIAVTPLARPTTSTGVGLQRASESVPAAHVWSLVARALPSWSLRFEPQHLTFPPRKSAQEWRSPAAIALTPLLRPATSTGVLLLIFEPLPSCPPELFPQHLTPPPLVSAQVCPPPAETALTPLLSPTTSIGARLYRSEHWPPRELHVDEKPFPSWPYLFEPQHLTPPPLVTTHV